MKHLTDSKGFAHNLVLMAVVVVVVIGGIGSYMLTKSHADSLTSEQKGGMGGGGPYVICLSDMKASPLPSRDLASTFKVKVKAPARNEQVRIQIEYSSGYGLESHLSGPTVTLKKAKTKIVTLSRITPRTLTSPQGIRYPVREVSVSLKTATPGFEYCHGSFKVR